MKLAERALRATARTGVGMTLATAAWIVWSGWNLVTVPDFAASSVRMAPPPAAPPCDCHPATYVRT